MSINEGLEFMKIKYKIKFVDCNDITIQENDWAYLCVNDRSVNLFNEIENCISEDVDKFIESNKEYTYKENNSYINKSIDEVNELYATITVTKNNDNNYKHCEGCGCLFNPTTIKNKIDNRCPHCGGGRGSILKTPVQRINDLISEIEELKSRI